MKPNDLKPPFKWSERYILLKDGILYLPGYYDCSSYKFPIWSHEDIFGNQNPVYIEYCSGNGQWIIEQAQKNPHINWVALEKRFDRVRKIWSKRDNLAIKNLFIVCGEAQPFAKHLVAGESVDGIYVNFPDPWPKDKHAKHRIIQSDFVSDCAETMKSGASMVLVTDDDTYRDQMLDVVSSHEVLQSEYPEPYYIQNLDGYGGSYFYSLWVELERQINYMRFTKK